MIDRPESSGSETTASYHDADTCPGPPTCYDDCDLTSMDPRPDGSWVYDDEK